MHQSAMYYGQKFFETYCNHKKPEELTVVEIGSQDVNGSLREVCPSGVHYIGLDFVEGKGVDIVINDPYRLPLEDASADIVVSSSCFEHSEFFWLVFLEVMRILKDDGVFYLNVPSNGVYHRYPLDCWRFYPDSGVALTNWAKRQGCNAGLLESFVGRRSEEDIWHDYVAVFIKEEKNRKKYPSKVLNSLAEYYSGYINGKSLDGNQISDNPDFLLLQHQKKAVAERDEQIASLNQAVAERDEQIIKNKRRMEQILVSKSWRITRPLRAIGRLLRNGKFT